MTQIQVNGMKNLNQTHSYHSNVDTFFTNTINNCKWQTPLSRRKVLKIIIIKATHTTKRKNFHLNSNIFAWKMV